ncbi:hypothetical protein J6590_031245 [Homalodisca vitripennis]|nr:hypothetical protein J6590_031245 [Homalodisca vitripennis]
MTMVLNPYKRFNRRGYLGMSRILSCLVSEAPRRETEPDLVYKDGVPAFFHHLSLLVSLLLPLHVMPLAV